jgi:predicted DNA binding protein
MITASVRVRLPETAWVSELSRSFPEATFKLLAGVRSGDTAIELGESIAADPERVSEAIAAHESILSYERLELTDRRSFSKYETTDTALYRFVEGSSFPPEFPIVVRDGWYELDITGTRSEFDRIRADLDAADQSYELRSLVEASESTGPLTDRQREVLEAAIDEGYFDVPRTCTLSELATTLGIDKSTASEIVRRGQARLVKQSLTGARQVGGDAGSGRR